jgi:hypothetical protein
LLGVGEWTVVAAIAYHAARENHRLVTKTLRESVFATRKASVVATTEEASGRMKRRGSGCSGRHDPPTVAIRLAKTHSAPVCCLADPVKRLLLLVSLRETLEEVGQGFRRV